MRITASIRLSGFSMALLFTGLPLAAQDLRDPTQAPAETPASAAPQLGAEGMTVMVRDGKRHLVVGTRWYAEGDSIGQLRVDRITETEVWLHDGKALLKVPRFAGIARSIAVPAPRCESRSVEQQAATASAVAQAHAGKIARKKIASPIDSASRPLPIVAPCEDTLP